MLIVTMIHGPAGQSRALTSPPNIFGHEHMSQTVFCPIASLLGKLAQQKVYCLSTPSPLPRTFACFFITSAIKSSRVDTPCFANLLNTRLTV